MLVCDHPAFDDHEDVMFCRDPVSGLRALIAVHRSGGGRALGGTRMHSYDDEAAALTDVLQLSRAMSLKCAMAGLPFGGGKAVMIGDPATDKTRSLLLSMAEHIDRLGGLFTTGEDVGIGVRDVEVMRERTSHLVGRMGEDSSGPTAYGVYHGIRAAVRHRLGIHTLCGVSVAVQGVGQVGTEVCRYLHRDGARLLIADTRDYVAQRLADELNATPVPADEIETAPATVLSPCGLGGTLTLDLARRLQAVVVVGAANNQLADPAVGVELDRRGILYAPDYVVNAGGVINNAMQLGAYDRTVVMADAARIHDTLMEVFRHAESRGIPPSQAADDLASERLAVSAGDPR